MAIYAQQVGADYASECIKLNSQPNNGDVLIWNQAKQGVDPISSEQFVNGIIKGYKAKRYFFSQF
jgi:hypothetical protein